jgi:CRISPR/Cas system CMR-associated protein Cmr3 (group 5 of RAMP superfamily)
MTVCMYTDIHTLQPYKSVSFSGTRNFQKQFYTKFSHLPLPARTVFKLPCSFTDNSFFTGRLKQSPVVKTQWLLQL